jgi:hypothetical protein
MKIIIDSSVLFDFTNIKVDMPERYRNFFTKMAELGYTVVIPETALLEFERRMEERISKDVGGLETAYSTLKYYGISYDQVEPRDIIKKINLVSLIRSCGTNVQIEKPTYEDFSEAQKRACLRLSPHPPDPSKSDEMRDLIIWLIAIRKSKEDSHGAVLFSRDKIHTNQFAQEEANSSNMFIAKEVEEALEFLLYESPGGKILKNLLEPVWRNLENEGFYVDKERPYAAFTKSIEEDKEGNFKAKGKIMRPLTDASNFEADVEICIYEGIIKEAIFTNIKKGKECISKQIVINPNIEYKTTSDYLERYSALKEALGEESL